MFKQFELNAGSGTALGVIIASAVALIVSTLTGDDSVWAWAIPLGIASGLAIGAGRASQRQKDEEAS